MRYMVLPVNDAEPAKQYFLKKDGNILFDFNASISKEPVYYAYLDVARFDMDGVTAEDADGNAVPYAMAEEIPPVEDLPGGLRQRPAMHFTTKIGWTNDPNGLVRANGKYRMFYQHNPVGHPWGNMTWGYAVSDDLVRWEEQGDVLFPDEMGSMFSGSAVVDHRNVAGFGKDAIILFYTAAAGHTELSKGKQYTQCIAYSTDGGSTFTKYADNPVVRNYAPGNRDPKVIWADEWQKYVMVLFHIEHRYAILTSDDLLHWEEIQEIEMPLDQECPDFFPLEVDGERCWVFSGAHDSYYVGYLADGKFVPTQENLQLQTLPFGAYAAQSFSNVENRRIRIYWGLNTARDGIFNNQMSVPVELFLRRTGDRIRLGAKPVPEVELLRKGSAADLEFRGGECAVPCGFDGCAADLTLKIRDHSADFTVNAFGFEIRVSPSENRYEHGGRVSPLRYDGDMEMRIFADTLGLEVFADGGLIFSASAGNADRALGVKLISNGAADVSVRACALSMEP